jgi:glycosyltransferase involved in cell wall biosynthesis
MRVCAITPHLPPEQAANALLPRQLAEGLAAHGVSSVFVAHPPRSEGSARVSSGSITYVPRRGAGAFARSLFGAMVAAARMGQGMRTPIRSSDVVHLHGNGFIVETAKAVADRYRKPIVITLYGTDVWHHEPRKHRRFGRVVREARARVFYSEALREFAGPLGLAPEPSRVIYAPVPARFANLDSERRCDLRRRLGVADGPLLLTVKRLHEVAGYDVLLPALRRVFEARPDAHAWIAGEGQLRSPLEEQAASLGLEPRVRFLGRLDNEDLWQFYAAADLFVLPSRLESWGTVMLEALACGTPVVATDTAGGLEVQSHFPHDVTLAPKEDADGLAAVIVGALTTSRRVSDAAIRRLHADFSIAACAAKYLDVYRSAISLR